MIRKIPAVIGCTVLFVLVLMQSSRAEDYLSCRNRCHLQYAECLKDAHTSEHPKAADKKKLCEDKKTECLKECDTLKQSSYGDDTKVFSVCRTDTLSHGTEPQGEK